MIYTDFEIILVPEDNRNQNIWINIKNLLLTVMAIS